MNQKDSKLRDRTRLKRLFDWGDEVTLVPYSGIQILDFGFDLEGRKFRRSFVERKIGERDGQIERRLESVPTDRDAEDHFLSGLGPDDNGPYPIDARKAMEPFLGKWVPVPVLRLKKERGPGGELRYDPGPSAWARARVVELDQPDAETGNTHRVQLSLDTALVAENSPDLYLAPERADVENPREFRLVSELPQMAWFLVNPKKDASGADVDMQRWASDWIKELFIEMLRQQRPGKPVIEADFRYKLEHWSRYLAFLALLEEFVRPPTLRFINTVSERDAVPPVEVDLVLDVGNSRTCGIMIERFPGEAQVDLRRSYLLEVRDLSRPEFSYEGLVESRVEFAEQQFGDERFASGSGRRNAFLWPSFVRVGPEAMRLVEGEKGTETLSGMSSPKRYLWDDTPIQQDWRFHNHHDPNSLPRAARAAMQYLNERGDVIEQVKSEERGRYRSPNKTSVSRAIRPRFSRSALFGFMLTELLAHALVYVNDPASRSRRWQADLPRRLSRVILTLPTATPIQEQAIIRSRAAGALKLLWKRLGMDDNPSNISARPSLIVDWDEASCTQLVYLYSEITQKFEGRIDDYVALKGRPRPSPSGRGMEPSLRVACIDIGGGTTDLMITTYRTEDDRMLHPEQTFREGFRIAGDDLLQRVVSGILLPQIIASIEKAGGQNVTERFRELFGGDTSSVEQQKIQRRIQFALRVLQPLAVALVEACEHTEDGGTIRVDTETVFGTSLLEDHDPLQGDEEEQPAALLLPEDLIDYVEHAAKSLGASAWTLQDFELVCERGEVDAVVRDVFQGALGNMVEVVDHLQSDIILLTGRPSRLPAVRTIVEEMMAVPPDRLVSMHRYRTDNWYPFRDPVTQRIGDPKSTVAVGGMLIALAEEQIPNFSVTTDAFRMKSTARFIGELGRNGQIQKERVFFENVDLDSRRPTTSASAEVKMYTPIYIGSRQLPLERWTTTPLYRLDFTQAAQGQKKPFKVTLVQADFDDDDESSEGKLRREALRESFSVEEIEDADGEPMRPSDVAIRLHTLGFEDSYWLDTGEFTI